MLSAQRPITQEHDELAFIVIHHVQELWLKLVAHELEAAIVAIRNDVLPPAFKALARVSRIQEQLIRAWDVLSTMTPADYLAFRDSLGPASGFQSFQYRLVEFRLGAKDAKMLLPHRHKADNHATLAAALAAPSLYDEALRLLARRGFAVPDDVLERDLTQAPRSRTRRSAMSGCRFTAPRRSISTCTSWPRNWSTSRTGSSNGASGI